MKKIFVVTLLMCSFLVLSACGSDTPSTVVKNYAESVDGDLSNNPDSPTQFQIGTGTTDLSGTVQQMDEDNKDPDYFTITVPEGGVLSALTLLNYESTFDGGAFIGMVNDNIFSVEDEGNDTDATALLGYALFGPDEVDKDLLPLLAVGHRGGAAPPKGFTPPLPAGDYTFWVQQTGPETQYKLQFKLDLGEGEPLD